MIKRILLIPYALAVLFIGSAIFAGRYIAFGLDNANTFMDRFMFKAFNLSA